MMLNKVYRDERERVTRELADAFTKKILSAPGKVPTKLDEIWSAGSPAPHLYAGALDFLPHAALVFQVASKYKIGAFLPARSTATSEDEQVIVVNNPN